MTDSEVILIGTGTCRLSSKRAQSSACIIDGERTLLLDTGAQSLEPMDKVGAFTNCKELHIHISHRHTDHLGGLFQLLQSLTFSDDLRHQQIEKVFIHATEEVCLIINKIRSIWGEEETSLKSRFTGSESRELIFQAGPDFDNWTYDFGTIKIESIHLPAHNNHGIRFSLNNKLYAFTVDATEANDSLFQFCKNADVAVFDFGHLSNEQLNDKSYRININPVVQLAVNLNAKVLIAIHSYLRHLQHLSLSEEEREKEIEKLISKCQEEAIQMGFKGRITVGHDLTYL